MTPNEKLIQAFDASNLSYGEHISHATIRQWAGLEIPTTDGMSPSEAKAVMDRHNLQYLTAVDFLKRYALETHKMLLKNVRGAGYTILLPSDQVDIAVIDGMKVIQRSLKQIERGVEHVQTEMLNQPQRAHRSSVRARLSGLKLMMGGKGQLLS